VTLKSVNIAIYAFQSKECERLFDCRCGVGVSEAEKFFCWTLFRHNILCHLFCHSVYLLSATSIGMTDELVNNATVDKKHIKHDKTLAHAAF